MGAGIIGASIAWRLASEGFEVTVYDAGSYSGEASSAAAGMLAPGGEVRQLAVWTQDLLDAHRQYREWAAKLQAASGHYLDLLPTTAIDLAFNDEEWEALQARRRMLAPVGVHAEELSAQQLREAAPGITQESCRALRFPEDALVSPHEITHALRILLDRLNVRIFEQTTIASCKWNNGHFTLRTQDQQDLPEADLVVLAAGAWSSTIDLQLPPQPQVESPREAYPVRGHMIYCHRDPGTLGPIVRHDHLYVLQRTNGSVLAGSSEERIGFDREPKQEIFDNLLARTRRILPELFPPTPDASWIGFRPGIEDGGPEVRQYGELPLWLAYGHYRNGIMLAPHTAERIAASVEAFAGKPA